jgi:hypothetical protein
VGTTDALKLSNRVSGEPLSYEIQIVRTPMHFGEQREWFLCPDCHKRFAILYVSSRRFLCRRCNGLAYRTQQGRAHGRQLIKAERLWKRAGLEFGGDGEKPKWMHWRTFNRLFERAGEAYMASWNNPRFQRLLEKADL